MLSVVGAWAQTSWEDFRESEAIDTQKSYYIVAQSNGKYVVAQNSTTDDIASASLWVFSRTNDCSIKSGDKQFEEPKDGWKVINKNNVYQFYLQASVLFTKYDYYANLNGTSLNTSRVNRDAENTSPTTFWLLFSTDQYARYNDYVAKWNELNEAHPGHILLSQTVKYSNVESAISALQDAIDGKDVRVMSAPTIMTGRNIKVGEKITIAPATDGDVIMYSIDGGANYSVYPDGGFTVSETVTVNAYAVDPDNAENVSATAAPQTFTFVYETLFDWLAANNAGKATYFEGAAQVMAWGNEDVYLTDGTIYVMLLNAKSEFGDLTQGCIVTFSASGAKSADNQIDVRHSVVASNVESGVYDIPELEGALQASDRFRYVRLVSTNVTSNKALIATGDTKYTIAYNGGESSVVWGAEKNKNAWYSGLCKIEEGEYTMEGVYDGTYFHALTKRTSNISVKVDDEGWFSFASSYAYRIPEGVTAYTGELYDGRIVLTALSEGDVIAAGEGIVFKGNNGTTYKFYDAVGTPISQANQFVGASVDTAPDQEANDYYVLAKADNRPKGFYHYVGTGNIPANRAYIAVAKQGNAPAYVGLGDEDWETIISAPSQNLPQMGDSYNVAGQHLGKLQRGINIVNGTKILVK